MVLRLWPAGTVLFSPAASSIMRIKQILEPTFTLVAEASGTHDRTVGSTSTGDVLWQQFTPSAELSNIKRIVVKARANETLRASIRIGSTPVTEDVTATADENGIATFDLSKSVNLTAVTHILKLDQLVDEANFPLSGAITGSNMTVGALYKHSDQSGSVIGDIVFSLHKPDSPVWTRVDHTDASVASTGTWTTYSHTDHFGGSILYSGTTNDTITYTFTGTGCKLVGIKSVDSGIVEMSIDDTVIGTYDMYSSNTQNRQNMFESTGLSSGTHTLKVRITGTKNASANNTRLYADAFEYVA